MRSDNNRSNSRWLPVWRWLVSVTVLGLLLVWLNPGAIMGQVRQIDPRWLLAALAVSVVQILLSAWRWRFTALKLDLTLPWRQAVSEYYLAGFINQVLPGGVLGDAWRARRHAISTDRTGPAWRAVIIERASGQLVVCMAAMGILVSTPLWREALVGTWGRAGLPGLLLIVTTVVILAVLLLARLRPALVRTLRDDVYRALLSPQVLPIQLLLSLLIVISYMLVFAMAARGIGIDLPFGWLLAVALPVLLAMLIPVTVAGWGLREATAAGVWLAMGLPAAQGVVVAASYGVVVFVATLPGLLVLLARPAAPSPSY